MKKKMECLRCQVGTFKFEPIALLSSSMCIMCEHVKNNDTQACTHYKSTLSRLQTRSYSMEKISLCFMKNQILNYTEFFLKKS